MELFKTINKVKGVEVGEKIGPDLSDYLKKYLTENDRAMVGVKSGVGISTLNSLAQGSGKVSDKSYPGALALVEEATAKCDAIMSQAKKDGNYLRSLSYSVEVPINQNQSA